MVRILFYVVALLALFAGAIAYGGNAIGAWDPLPPPPPPPPGVEIDHTKAKKEKHTGGSQAVERLSHAEKAWVRKADALCRRSHTESKGLAAKAYGTATRSGAMALFAQVRALNKEMNDRFLALGAPRSYRPDIRRLRKLFQQEERYFDAMYQAVVRNDMQTYVALADRLTDVALDESDIAADLGAFDCDVDLLPSFG
ncbi:MAG: hypothetical protein ABI649_05085 [Gaiellaceae bacterium]